MTDGPDVPVRGTGGGAEAKERDTMKSVHDGQCGLCVHFGEFTPQERPKLVQIRTARQAPEDLVEECSHPAHAKLHLVVTPISGCQGFEPAPIPGRTAGD